MEDDSVIHVMTIIIILILFHQGLAVTYDSRKLCPGSNVELKCPDNSLIGDVKYSLLDISGACEQNNSLYLDYKSCIGSNWCGIRHTNLDLSQFHARTWSLSIQYSCQQGSSQESYDDQDSSAKNYKEKTTCFTDLNTTSCGDKFISIQTVSINEDNAVCGTVQNRGNNCNKVAFDEIFHNCYNAHQCYTKNMSKSMYECMVIPSVVNISFTCTDGNRSLGVGLPSVNTTSQTTRINSYIVPKQNTGIIAGICLGISCGLIITIIIILFCWRRSKQKRRRQSHMTINTGQHRMSIHGDPQTYTGLLMRSTGTSEYTEMNIINPSYDYIDTTIGEQISQNENANQDSVDTYMVLDPTETGFDRQFSSPNGNRSIKYDMAAMHHGLPTNIDYSVDLNHTELSIPEDKMLTLNTPYALLDPTETSFDRNTSSPNGNRKLSMAAMLNDSPTSIDYSVDLNHTRLTIPEDKMLNSDTSYAILDPTDTGFDRKASSPNENGRCKLDKAWKFTGSTANKYIKQTGLSRSPDQMPTTCPAYTILDPAETGFDRNKSSMCSISGNGSFRTRAGTEDKYVGSSTKNDYSVIDQNLCHKESSRPIGITNTSYIILDPTETGFDRHTEETGQHYGSPGDKNIYSRCVDSTYDSTDHRRKNIDDQIYDHCSGQRHT